MGPLSSGSPHTMGLLKAWDPAIPLLKPQHGGIGAQTQVTFIHVSDMALGFWGTWSAHCEVKPKPSLPCSLWYWWKKACEGSCPKLSGVSAKNNTEEDKCKWGHLWPKKRTPNLPELRQERGVWLSIEHQEIPLEGASCWERCCSMGDQDHLPPLQSMAHLDSAFC